MQVKRKLFHISKIFVIIILIINIILVILNYIRIGMFHYYDGIDVSQALALLDNDIPFKQYITFIGSLYDDMIIQLIFLISIFVLFIILLITNNRQTNSTDRN